MVTVSLLLFVLIFCYTLFALFLWLGAYWAKIPQITYKRSLATLAAIFLLNLSFTAGMMVLVSAGLLPTLLGSLIEFAVGLLLNWLVIAWLFRASIGRAILAWLPLTLSAGGFLALYFLVIKPYVFQFYIVPTNNMAPTIIGWHKSTVCAHCGDGLVVPYQPDLDDRRAADKQQVSICKNCLQTAKVSEEGGEIGSPDRIMCCTLLFPRRWDLVVFHPPHDPSELYVDRLVALPGEEVVIKEGAIWINGKKMRPPEDIAQLKFTVEPAEDAPGFDPMWGSPKRPARLGDDEYFVMGDFGLRSGDSRNWPQGAEGHPPFAVPRSHIVGVATAIYWPPSRWRIFR